MPRDGYVVGWVGVVASAALGVLALSLGLVWVVSAGWLILGAYIDTVTR